MLTDLESESIEIIREAVATASRPVMLYSIAKLMVDAGLIVIVSLISPYQSEMAFARSLFEPGEFYETFMDASISECERRDPKGLYASARRGEIKNFTGIDSVYEVPQSPDLSLDTMAASAHDCVERVMRELIL